MADIPPKSTLELQIEQEKAELEAVPKIPIKHFMGGPGMRCHLCGKLCDRNTLQPFDAHKAENGAGPEPRLACPDCHPNRGQQ